MSRALRTREISSDGAALRWYANQQSVNLSIVAQGKWCSITLDAERLAELIDALTAASDEIKTMGKSFADSVQES